MQATETVQSVEVPEVEANTYAGYTYSATIVDGAMINVYYDLVGVEYHAATESGLITSRGSSAITTKEVDGKAMISYVRTVAGASGNELMINVAGFTAGNYLVLKIKVTKTHDSIAYTWVQGAAQAWASYIDFAVDMDDASDGNKGWGYISFKAPTSADGSWFYVNLFDWNWLGDISIEAVYEITPEAYDTFFSVEE